MPVLPIGIRVIIGMLGDGSNRDAFLSAGADGFLEKPLDESLLMAELRKWVTSV